MRAFLAHPAFSTFGDFDGSESRAVSRIFEYRDLAQRETQNRWSYLRRRSRDRQSVSFAGRLADSGNFRDSLRGLGLESVEDPPSARFPPFFYRQR